MKERNKPFETKGKTQLISIERKISQTEDGCKGIERQKGKSQMETMWQYNIEVHAQENVIHTKDKSKKWKECKSVKSRIYSP